MKLRERVGGRFKRVATWCKRACYLLIAASVVALISGLFLFGGIQGYGAIGIIVSLLLLVIALIAGMGGLVLGGAGGRLAPERPSGSVAYCVSPGAAHGLDPAEPEIEAEIMLAFEARGHDRAAGVPSEPGEVIALIDQLGRLDPWTRRERSAIWTLLAKVISEQQPHLPSFARLERAVELLGGGVPRIRLATGLDPASVLSATTRSGFKRRQTAVDPVGNRPSGAGERAIIWAANLGAAGIFIAKFAHAFLLGATPQTKQSIAGWVLVVMVVGGLFVGLRYYLKWRRVRMASWDVETGSSGFQAKKRFDPLRRPCRVEAARCWVIVGADPVYRGELQKPRFKWYFFFPDEPGWLESMDFDSSGTPWEAALRQMSEVVNMAHPPTFSDQDFDV